MIIGRYLTQINHLSLKGFILYKKVYATSLYNIIEDRMASKQLTQTYLIYQNLHLRVSGSY